MTTTSIQIVFDCADPSRLCDFWVAALGYEKQALPPERERELREAGIDVNLRAVAVDPEHRRPRMCFRKAPEAPEHPAGAGAAAGRVRIAITAPDASAEVSRLTRLGASVAQVRAEPFGELEESWTVMRDPEGNELFVQPA